MDGFFKNLSFKIAISWPAAVGSPEVYLLIYLLEKPVHNTGRRLFLLADENDENFEFVTQNKIPLKRKFANTVVNRHGNQLIDLCWASSVYILNGGIGRSMHSTKCTCKAKSVIDYILSSAPLFGIINY